MQTALQSGFQLKHNDPLAELLLSAMVKPFLCPTLGKYSSFNSFSTECIQPVVQALVIREVEVPTYVIYLGNIYG